MELTAIKSCQDALYAKFRQIYTSSFPIFEQRNEAQQQIAFDSPCYRLWGYENGLELVGFISFWLFDDYCYIEHFAVNSTLRGMGQGSKLMCGFIEKIGKPVILEIDPVVDSITEARLRFYIRCGFRQNDFAHQHPSYRPDFKPHSLVVLSTEHKLTDAEYSTFVNDLHQTVMNEV